MTSTLNAAQPALQYISPQFNSAVLNLAKIVLPWGLKLQTNIEDIEVDNADILIKLYQQFQQGKIRLLLAFRHPRTEDPLCLASLFWQILPQEAKKRGIMLNSPVHAHFVFDRGIPLWAGNWIGWLYSRLGGSSIQRGKLDLLGLKGARNLFLNGKFPLAIAPEGATNGHNDIISPLEPGIAQLSFWCAEDLEKAARSEEVIVLPMGIKYSYLDRPWSEIASILSQLENDCGIVNSLAEESINNDNISDAQIEKLYCRLMKIAAYLLSEMENFYSHFYHQHLAAIESEEKTEKDPNQILALRLKRLLDAVLKVAENYFYLQTKGDIVDRCRRIEQAAWDYIYQRELKEDEQISSVRKGLADRVAQEAQLHIWHMRIVESFVAVTGNYVKEDLSAERFAETVTILWDLVTRIKEGNPFDRPQFGRQKVNLIMGEPILIRQRYPSYKSNRRQGIDNLTNDLKIALSKTIQS
jgi:hypothetical protein